ncbi:MAG: rRNA maturation RNase YbeY, partial [Balneolales bacterium]|nr:rRNA maturation RNase YbeY [Balneolales bacterium]
GISVPVEESKVAFLLSEISSRQHCRYEMVEIVFVDENEIVRINKEHLKREYVTDIISFRYDDNPSNQEIEGTLFCCAPRIAEQSREYANSEAEEYYRVIIHGLIHLIGYDDSTQEEKKEMTLLEDHFLSLLT